MKIKAAQPNVAEVDMTPMIDIVFQLIAFFMVITNFDQAQADERVKLPADQLARPPEVAREQELVLNVGYIREGGQVVSDPLVFFNGEQLPVDRIENSLMIERKIYLDKGTNIEDVTIVIRADKDMPTGKVQDVIIAAQNAKFQKFALSAASDE